MSICTVCQKDSRKHSEKLWEMHKQMTKCLCCDKTSDAHSEMLWDMHKGNVENARRKTSPIIFLLLHLGRLSFNVSFET